MFHIVPILSLKIMSGKHKTPKVLSLAHCTIVQTEVFCDAKNAPNLKFLAGALPWTPLHWGSLVGWGWSLNVWAPGIDDGSTPLVTCL